MFRTQLFKQTFVLLSAFLGAINQSSPHEISTSADIARNSFFWKFPRFDAWYQTVLPFFQTVMQKIFTERPHFLQITLVCSGAKGLKRGRSASTVKHFLHFNNVNSLGNDLPKNFSL